MRLLYHITIRITRFFSILLGVASKITTFRLLSTTFKEQINVKKIIVTLFISEAVVT